MIASMFCDFIEHDVLVNISIGCQYDQIDRVSAELRAAKDLIEFERRYLGAPEEFTTQQKSVRIVNLDFSIGEKSQINPTEANSMR